MAGQTQFNGNQAGPQPWWQLPGGAGSRTNLEKSAPGGYYYDPVKMGYERTPESEGSDAAKKLNAAMAGLGGPGGPGSPSPAIDYGGGGTGGGDFPTIPTIAPPDPTAATNAAFAGAKDQVGAMSRASLTSLNDELGASGMIGSGAQVQGTRDIIAGGAGQMGQVSRDLAGKNADQAADFAKLGYQGGITQRGQDIASREAAARLAAEERRAREALLQRILSGLGD